MVKAVKEVTGRGQSTGPETLRGYRRGDKKEGRIEETKKKNVMTDAPRRTAKEGCHDEATKRGEKCADRGNPKKGRRDEGKKGKGEGDEVIMEGEIRKKRKR